MFMSLAQTLSLIPHHHHPGRGVAGACLTIVAHKSGHSAAQPAQHSCGLCSEQTKDCESMIAKQIVGKVRAWQDMPAPRAIDLFADAVMCGATDAVKFTPAVSYVFDIYESDVLPDNSIAVFFVKSKGYRAPNFSA